MPRTEESLETTVTGTLREGRSWRRETAHQSVRARWFAGRLLLTMFVLGLAAYFVFLMQRPFEHARPQLILFGEPVAGEAVPERVTTKLPFGGFPRRDFDAFSQLAGVTGRDAKDVPPRIDAPGPNDGLRTLQRRLDEIVGPESVALVYVTARGVSIDGRALLLWNRLADGRPTRTELRELVDALAASPARTKVLLLDAGNVRTLPEEGMLVNEFERLLGGEVTRTGDRSLWVLLSHSMLEVSHVSYDERRSVFGKFVVEGLAGAADGNADRAVDLAELYEYTARSVGRWVDQQTVGKESQTPRLFWGGGAIDDAEPPVLVPVLEAAQDEATEANAAKPAGAAKSSETGGDAEAGAPAAGDSGTPATPTAAASPTTAKPADTGSAAAAVSNGKGGSPAVATESSASAAANGGPSPWTGRAGTVVDAVIADAAAVPPSRIATSGTAADVEDVESAAEGVSGRSTDRPRASMEMQAAANVERIVTTLTPIEALLHDTWSLRDRLLDRRFDRPTAADASPGAWRDLERTLLAYDGRIRREQDGTVVMQNAIVRLQEEFRRLDTASRAFPPQLKVRTLGMLERWGATDDVRREWIATFDATVAASTDNALRAFVSGLAPTAFQFEELRLARACLDGGTEWGMSREILRVRRRAEQVVASCGWTANWMARAIESAEASLLVAERVLIDAVDPVHDGARIDRLLRESRRGWDDVERSVATLRRARCARNDLALRLEDDVDWAFDVADAVRAGIASPVQVEELVVALGDLAELLRTPDATRLEEVSRATVRLDALRQRFEWGLQPAFVVALVEANATGVPRGFLEALLANPACRAEVRLLAIEALRREDRVAVGRVHGNSLAWTARLRPTLVGERWRRYVELAEHEVALTELTARASGIPVDGSEASAVALEELRRAGASLGMDDGECDELCRVFRRLGRGLVEQRRAYRVKRPSWAAFGDTGVVSTSVVVGSSSRAVLVGTADLIAVLELQARLTRAGLHDANATEESMLIAEAEATTRSLARLAGSRAVEGAVSESVRSSLRLSGPTVVATESTGRGTDVTIELDWRGNEATTAWIVVDTDDTTKVLDRGGSQVVMTRWLGGDAIPPDDLFEQIRRQPPLLELRGGRPSTVKLAVVREPGAKGPARIVVHAVTPNEAVRTTIVVDEPAALPVVVRCEGIERSFAVESEGIVLHPFPNRATDYRLLAASTDGRERTVVAELYVPRDAVPVLPRGALLPDAARTLLDRLAPAPPFAVRADLVLPQDGSAIAIPWTVGTLPVAGTNVTVRGTEADAAGGAALPGPPEGSIPCGRNLLLVLRDAAAGTVDVRLVPIAPQQPRRYLRPRVEYDGGTRRIKVEVAANDTGTSPRGEIALRARFLPPLPPGTPQRSSARIVAGGPAGELSARIPTAVSEPMLMFVEADGWPRAFAYRIDPTRSNREVPEVRDFLAVQIVGPAERTAFAGAVRSIPVRLEADLPRVTGSSADQGVVVGFDLNGDRKLTGEPTTVLAGDRAVTPFATILPDGRLSLFTTVADHEVSLPVPPSTDAVLDLLARVDAGTRSGWSPGLPVVLDGRPPRIESFVLEGGASAVLGPPLQGIVSVTDDGLSGVVAVEATFDLDGSGEFPKMGPTLNGTRGEDDIWRITIPTEGLAGGEHVLLVRAVDAVGNVSAVGDLRLTAVTQAAIQERIATTTRTVRGRVTYLGEPVAGAKVVLDAGAEVDPPTIATNETGVFEFTGVKPGTYTVTARARVRDRNREQAEALVVPTVPAEVPTLELKLPYKRSP